MNSSESNKQVAGSHTPEPWSQYLWNGSNAGSHVMDSDGKTIALVMRDNDKANASRIVACVNACEGISTNWLESGCTGWLNNTREERNQYQRERDNAIYERDQLLAALEACVRRLEDVSHPEDQNDQHGAIQRARAAIAAVKGGAA